VRQRALVIDAVLGIVVAVLVFIISPGLAVTAIVAVIVLVALGLDGVLRRRRPHRRRGRVRGG